MEIVGKVIQILPTQSGTGSNGKAWELAQFVIETQEQYPRKVCIDMFGSDRIKNNPVSIDQVVTVSYDLESREFNGRWYTSVRAWKVTPYNSEADADAAPAEANNPQQPAQAANNADYGNESTPGYNSNAGNNSWQQNEGNDVIPF